MTDVAASGFPTRPWTPGVQWAFRSNGAARRLMTSGFADAASKRPVTEETLFLSASTTKLLTALMTLQCVERGELDLHASLPECLPNLPCPPAVTVAMLLSHRSGLANPNPMSWVHPASDHALFDEHRALTDVLQRFPVLRSRPGTRYAYSNVGYWLLGAVLQRASGKPFADLLVERVMAPLGLTSEDMSAGPPPSARMARGHLRRYGPVHALMRLRYPRQLDGGSGRWVRLVPLMMNGPAFGGVFARAAAYLSVAEDLLKPVPHLLSPAGRDAFLNPEQLEPGTANAFGLCVGELEGTLHLGKPGGGPGFSSNLRIYPQVGLASVWMANALTFSAKRIERLTDQMDRGFLRQGGAAFCQLEFNQTFV